MSSDVVIRVANVAKSFNTYSRPRDRLVQSLYSLASRIAPGDALRQRFHRAAEARTQRFWALRDISFELKKGETVGIIGRNGSGKSTLLQIICGTLAPTLGEVTINGRVAALLELGSGFNPEYTGRENVYLNGQLLGLTREQLDSKFDEIAAFADIGEFIELPVNTYSSGMFVRLAFAVAINVEPEVLIVDEALSVGDAFFQAKCIAKLKELMSAGVTILFVSHDTHAVRSLCQRGVLLDGGRLEAVGAADRVVELYYSRLVEHQQQVSKATAAELQDAAPPSNQNEIGDTSEFDSRATFQRIQNGKAAFSNVRLIDEHGKSKGEIDFGDRVTLRMSFRSNVAFEMIGLAYHIRDSKGVDVVYSDTGIEDSHLKQVASGDEFIVDWTFRVTLREGTYTIACMLSEPIDLTFGRVDVCDFVPIAVQFRVARGDSLPIYGAVHWANKVEQRRISQPESADA